MKKGGDLPAGTRQLLLLGGVLGLLGGSPASAGELMRTEGRLFVDADGQAFAIKGISLGNWLVPEGYMFHFNTARSPHAIDAVFRHAIGDAATERFWRAFRENYVTEADVDFLARAGFNTLRVPLHWALFMRDAEPPAFTGPGDALLDRLIGWCRQARLHVILDLHAAPGGQTGVNHDDGLGFPLTFYVPRYRRQTIALWVHLASRYANNSVVLGYDLLNEPISPYADEAFLNPRLETFYQDIVHAVRAVDPDHILFLEGAQWASNFAVFGKPFAPNLAYSYHMFWAPPTRAAIERILDFSYVNNVPLLLGETGELNDSWDARFRKLQEKYGIGWSFWAFKTMESTSTVLSIQHVPGWEAIEALGDASSEDWQPVTAAARAEAQAAVDAYLRAMRFEQTKVNFGYLRGLGLSVDAGAKEQGRR